MSGRLLDVMLDELVAGEDGQEVLSVWEDLLRTPGAAERWEEAVVRRRRTDNFAAALMAHPWLARMMGHMQQLRRSVVPYPKGGFDVLLAPDILSAVLGPTSGQPTRLVAPQWGRVEVVELALHSTVELRVSSSEVGDFQVFYKSAAGDGRVRSRRWKLEPGDAPVLLLGAMGAGAAQGLEAVLARATNAGGVLLVEAPRSESREE